MELETKLAILADAAKYDASCASSGAPKRSAAPGKGMGSTTGMGICHSYTPDGRCVSLLKILLTNFCLYDCLYCINRRSSDIPRARFSVQEVVDLTLSFYRRNYIEGLFLSSGIIRNADYTMEQLVLVARTLREEHEFRGYIHLKTIPEASPELVEAAGRYADRLSVNIELPTREALTTLAPEKSDVSIKRAMGEIRLKLDEKAEAGAKAPKFSPAGQSTQLIVGADDSSDASIMETADTLYRSYKLRRIYYSAFSPIQRASVRLPNRAPPLMREHRLYQADWLMRYYDFSLSELSQAMPGGKLDLNVDPKTTWALANRDQFPVDVNTAERHMLLRVPGLGVRVIDRIISSRRHRRLRYQDLKTMGATLKRARHFICTVDYRPSQGERDSDGLRRALISNPQQQSLF
ncbi:putative DNA modification/repair radical SAM protein [Steroidobacter sp. S1-65]|uniref:DNA modification/repair radical SAM protein n=1 Tax=Steroidobacter gossypii TaxID=2805490 RepID=A0ABS1X4H6_9GAMM|nr:putative DNA modification/repair radical SAM protein [Steroidobacter gossypii]MBM0108120.1 putative DNA modification/repair radical SAM protein [Steroidobacter gossypii]